MERGGSSPPAGLIPVIKFSKKNPSVELPSYQSGGAAGMDIRAFLADDHIIPPMGRARIPTGLFAEVEPGYELQIRPRSGLADRFGITVLNSPGTIDSNYRGEIEVILINLGKDEFRVKNGERIAQMVMARAARADIIEGELTETKRGGEGFGSTGV